MRISFISTFLPSTYIGGAEILTEMIARELVKNGHTVTIFTGSERTNKSSEGVDVQTLPLLRPKPLRAFFSPLNSLMLQKILLFDVRFLNSDIIHVVDIDTLSLLSGWSCITDKLVATIQDYGAICPAGDLLDGSRQCPNYCHNHQGFLCLKNRHVFPGDQLRLKCAYTVRKIVRDESLKHLKYAVCVSKFVEKELSRVAPQIKTKVIGNCVSDNWFRQTKLKKDYDVLYVGHLAWYKGVDVLVDALKRVITKRSLRVGFVGSGNIELYKRLTISKGLQSSIEFIGEVKHEKIIQYYQRAKLIVAPSIWPEPCGRTIIEGMATGCPVIATTAGGTPESMRNGIHGMLVSPGNSIALAQAIIKLLGDPQKMKTMGRQARIHAQKTYNIHSIVNQYETFYGLILKYK